jgi:hypothetical protein
MTTTPERSDHRPPQLVDAVTSATTGDDAVAPTHPAPDAAATPLSDSKDLKALPVRGLLAELGSVESRLRDTPFLLSGDGRTRVNPEAALLLARQRAIVEQLRRRRVTWTASAAPRERSAARPAPPWS